MLPGDSVSPLDLRDKARACVRSRDSYLSSRRASRPRRVGATALRRDHAPRFPNVYGIDMPTKEELVAHGRSEEDVAKYIGADAVVYLVRRRARRTSRQRRERAAVLTLGRTRFQRGWMARHRTCRP